ncbi:MAG: glyceraldehyde 3-phosphate dehydrogenase NAD-binding domain-containing protein, partial [Salegentibacter mishustinae]|nr:glyceraldehyde 3-phosphate dehydrogenase NAD-binding domain-containing protein [Salegentibacter mishustinae]
MSKSINIAINGFGRIGRSLFRLLIDNKSINVVAIN